MGDESDRLIEQESDYLAGKKIISPYDDGFDIAWDEEPKKPKQLLDAATNDLDFLLSDSMREMFGGQADYLDDDVGNK